MHDPRIGRFFAVDPLAADYPYNSPYAFSENNVIAFVELEGLEKAQAIEPLESFKAKLSKAESVEFILYVDQPGIGGDRDIHEGFDAGHTFVGIRITNADGTTEEVNFGFYPTNRNYSGNPENFKSEGIVKENNGYAYDVKFVTSIDTEEAEKVIDYTIGVIDSKKTYSLCDYNCSDFGLEAAKEAGVDYIPDTEGQWDGGSGTNPADLGEDVRKLNTRTGQEENNEPYAGDDGGSSSNKTVNN